MQLGGQTRLDRKVNRSKCSQNVQSCLVLKEAKCGQNANALLSHSTVVLCIAIGGPALQPCMHDCHMTMQPIQRCNYYVHYTCTMYIYNIIYMYVYYVCYTWKPVYNQCCGHAVYIVR